MSGPALRLISGDASPDEVAAIIAVVTALEAERRAAHATAGATGPVVSAWVDASRRAGRSVAAPRGSWRLSARVPRRIR